MTILTKENFNNTLESTSGLLVIDLYADWCYPCKMLSPTLSELESEYPEVSFFKINVDEEPELAALFKVSSIPMVAFVKDNVFLDFTVGVVPKDELKGKIDSLK